MPQPSPKSSPGRHSSPDLGKRRPALPGNEYVIFVATKVDYTDGAFLTKGTVPVVPPIPPFVSAGTVSPP